MKVFHIDAQLRTKGDIDFTLSYFVFVKREKIEDRYVYTMRDSQEQLVKNILARDPFSVALESDNWMDAVSAHFDENVRSLNDRVDNVIITEIVI